MGACILRKYRTENIRQKYSVPTLTLGAELDGLMRITRLTEALYHSVIRVGEGVKDPIREFPVIVIEGANHLQFSDESNIPLMVKMRDLKAEISQSEAHNEIAKAISAFLDV